MSRYIFWGVEMPYRVYKNHIFIVSTVAILEHPLIFLLGIQKSQENFSY